MLGSLSGIGVIVVALIVIVAIVVAIILAVRASSKRNARDQERQAYEAGVRQAELQRAFEAGLNGQQRPGAE